MCLGKKIMIIIIMHGTIVIVITITDNKVLNLTLTHVTLLS